MLNADQHVRTRLNKIGYAEKLLEDQKYEESWAVLQGALADARSNGISSSGLCLLGAIVCDFRQDFEGALALIGEAVAHDPLSVRAWRSYHVIVERIKTALLDEDVPADSPEKARLHGLLVESGEVDADAHVVYARHLHAVGQHADALRILEAVCFLFPQRADALVLAASVARALGVPGIAPVDNAVAFDRLEGPALLMPMARA